MQMQIGKVHANGFVYLPITEHLIHIHMLLANTHHLLDDILAYKVTCELSNH